MILEENFAWNGQTFGSLSQIAREKLTLRVTKGTAEESRRALAREHRTVHR